ncbi:hypothetical protein EHM92_04550 [bacterium]|nr:MAG: hypothetical protein EHM92_04550 [bacterium]
MKKLIMTLLLLPALSAHANPFFTIGSNPFYTYLAYPHDILRWPSKAAFWYMYPQTLPWQGHVTNISERPNDTYISNYNDFEFPVPDGYTGDPKAIRSFMKVSSYAYNTRYSAGGIWGFGDLGKVYLELGTNRVDMELRADGIVRNNNTMELIPVAARTDALRRYYDFQLVYANYLFGNPIGLRAQYQIKDTGKPQSSIRFTKNGVETVSDHLTWGWTTSPCAHIFETSSQNFDAWFLNDYTLYKGGQLDLQLSYEYGDHKSGIRYRHQGEHGQNFFWRSSIADSLPGADFLGAYITDPRYEDEISNDLIRAYSKIRFWKIGDADLGLLFFLQYADRDNNTVSTNKDLDSEPLRSDAESEYTIEVNPWMTYKFGKSYFDFGLLFEFSTTGMENTSPRWNGAIGATQNGVVRNSYAYTGGFSPSWESFSGGRDNFFSTGFEASTAVNINGRFFALASVLLLRKYSFIEKEYGSSDIPAGGREYGFTVSNTRNDYKNETWMTGSIGLMCGWGPFQILGTMQLPLAYLLEKNTELSDSRSTLVDLTQRNVWAVQEPISFRLLVGVGL